MIEPYKRPPATPRVGVLTSAGRYTDEDGCSRSLERAEPGTHLYADRYEAEGWVRREGAGVATCWNLHPIWYHPPAGPKVRLLPDMPGTTEARMRGLVGWRDWLARYGASGHGTRSASMSLLRATLRRRLWVGWGDGPDVPWVMGGRVTDAKPQDHGVYAWVSHFDLAAAYATTVGRLLYGGAWLYTEGRVPPHTDADMVLVRARVKIPDMAHGPLPARPKGLEAAERIVFPTPYPVGAQVTGTWTAPELAGAERAGAHVKVLGAWVHRGGRPVFAKWWDHVAVGRALPGYAGELAKMTGNQLWSAFCVMADGERTVLRGERHTPEALPGGGSPHRDHGLAEWVTGTIRGRMFSEVLEPYADDVVCVHTDGAWVITGGHHRDLPAGEGWRLKDVAAVMHYLGPQFHRHKQPDRVRWHYTVSGVERATVGAAFDAAWDRYLFDASRRSRSTERQEWEKQLEPQDREALHDARRTA